eukprot:gene2115-8010_t
MADVQIIQRSRCHEGYQCICEHTSSVLNCRMRFSIYLPLTANSDSKTPTIYFLSGLTRNESTCPEQGDAQRFLSQHKLCMVWPDTSPRKVPTNENVTSVMYGPGASFYVDAAQKPWSKHYCMFTYITDELPKLIEQHFPVNGNKSVCGHSMGGYGSLLCAIKQPSLYKCVSVFAPLCSILKSPVSEQAFTQYFGDDKAHWMLWDVNTLVPNFNVQGSPLPILVDQGSIDEYLVPDDQLFVDEFVAFAEKNPSIDVNYKVREEFDHGYFFLQTFIEEHIQFHAQHLSM